MASEMPRASAGPSFALVDSNTGAADFERRCVEELVVIGGVHNLAVHSGGCTVSAAALYL